MKPICVPCQRFYRPKKNGCCFTEGYPIDNNALPGKVEPEKWRPYKLWMGDKWECPDCSSEIIVGVGQERLAEHYEPDFLEVRERYGGDELLVKDC